MDGQCSIGSVQPREVVPPWKVERLFRKSSGWSEPIHSVLDRNFRTSLLNGSRPSGIMFECFDISKALKFYFGFQRGEGAGNGGRRQRGTSNAINIPLNTGIHNFYRMKKYQGVDKVPFKLCIFGE